MLQAYCEFVLYFDFWQDIQCSHSQFKKKINIITLNLWNKERHWDTYV